MSYSCTRSYHLPLTDDWQRRRKDREIRTKTKKRRTTTPFASTRSIGLTNQRRPLFSSPSSFILNYAGLTTTWPFLVNNDAWFNDTLVTRLHYDSTPPHRQQKTQFTTRGRRIGTRFIEYSTNWSTSSHSRLYLPRVHYPLDSTFLPFNHLFFYELWVTVGEMQQAMTSPVLVASFFTSLLCIQQQHGFCVPDGLKGRNRSCTRLHSLLRLLR